jgi:hypothetical protein
MTIFLGNLDNSRFNRDNFSQSILNLAKFTSVHMLFSIHFYSNLYRSESSVVHVRKQFSHI